MKIAIIYNKDLTDVINRFGMQDKEKYNPETERRYGAEIFPELAGEMVSRKKD